MLCKSCGAKMEETELLCPYCGAENEKLAAVEQNTYIKHLHQKTESVDKDVPEQQAKRANSWLTKLVLGVVVLAVIALVIGALVSRYFDATSIQRQQKKLDRLESLYQQEDYEGLEEYLRECGEHGGEFRKYEIIVRLYDDCEIYVSSLKTFHLLMENNPESEVTDNYAEQLGDVFKKMEYIDELEEKGFIYGEKEFALETRKQYIQALKEYLLLTEEEIVEAKQQYMEEDIDYEVWKKLSLERVMQNEM